MNVRQITGIYFSPTGHTRYVAERIGARLPGVSRYLDLTDAEHRPDYHFTEDEAVLAAVPVYGGRVPAAAAERLKSIHGHGTPAVLAVTYGNRAYEDALVELADILKEQGFKPIAAAAAVAEHNIAEIYGAGRPDEKDNRLLDQFGDRAARLLEELPCGWRSGELKVKGNRPYRKYGTLPIHIKVSSSCSGCGLCVKKCPVQAISRTDPKVTDPTGCIACMRCVQICPTKSRRLGVLVKLAIRRKLKKVCQDRKEPEFFYEAGK
ncbi:MAG: EFR1 family ferrodoxin [Eubacteriales bacterium]|nr:EFR1 family ferrodoxin [Eubacteriales bacterium]